MSNNQTYPVELTLDELQAIFRGCSCCNFLPENYQSWQSTKTKVYETLKAQGVFK